MKHLSTLILALMFILACTPEKGGNDNGGSIIPSEDVTVWGVVYADGTNTIQGVVVSDGLSCVLTDENGYFQMRSDLSRTRFITVSIPSGYSVPVDSNGLPMFYHRVTDEERARNMVKCSFTFAPINNNPDRYTLIVGADPQPRPKTAKWDNIAYHSLDICDDLYRDMREKAATITDRKVYGLMLGDIVHEHMPLFDNYVESLKTLGFPMFNVIGNHDNDLSSADDTEGRHCFEEHLGPAYYSFNIGEWHFVVLDNLIMRKNDDGLLNQYDHGLTDEIWEWLQNDLSFVDRSTGIMVAAHAPMFMRTSMFDSSTATGGHRSDYARLFTEFDEVHAWAGHTHITFNYVYPETSDRRNINVHTLTRSTGDGWTNEWCSNGTPRGYTVVEIDGDKISWYFKPTVYQQSAFTGQTPKQPEYRYRDWDYDSDGVARMKSDNSILDESYQMKVFPPGQYHKTFADAQNGGESNRDEGYVYADIFLWDEAWEIPEYNGVKMERVSSRDAYSLLDFEIKSHYYACGYLTKNHSSYCPTDNDIFTIFRAKESSKNGTGTVTVTDRFGNIYSKNINW